MSNPKFIQNWYKKLWSWPDEIKDKIGDIGDWLQYMLPISFLIYCLFMFGLHGLTVYFIGFFVCCVGTSTLMKMLFNNLRPREWDDVSSTPENSPDMDFDWSPLEGQSFTSSHSASAFGGAVPWFLVNPFIGVIATLLACFVGFSRIVVKAHWLRDVLGAIGIVIIWSLIFVFLII